jgi:DnaJ-class molecular chaperone
MSFYEILEVPETASMEEIKKSYRTLSLKYHPDRNPGKPEMVAKFQKINEAYEILGDESKRKEHDMMNKNPFAHMMGGMGGMHMGGMHMGGMPGMHMGGVHMDQGIDEIFSNLFGMQFGGGIPGMQMHGGPNIRIFRNGVPVNIQQQLQKPTPIIQTINVTIEQVLNGGSIPIEIERWLIEHENKVFEKETLYINIPKGVDDNEIIVLQDKGNKLTEQCKGDIKLFIKVINNTEFERSGLDLLIHKNISLKDALCGFSFELKYINNKVYTIHNNSGNIIQPEYRKVIQSMGLEREDKKGNLIIIFHIQFPEKLSEDAIEQLKLIL